MLKLYNHSDNNIGNRMSYCYCIVLTAEEGRVCLSLIGFLMLTISTMH